MAVRLAADLRPSADGSAVRTFLVAGQLQAASVSIAWAATLIAKFHYTGPTRARPDPTGPSWTRTDPHGLCRRPARTQRSFAAKKVRAGPCGSVRVRAGQLVSDNVRGLFLVVSGPVGSGRARVMEFSYKQPACYSLGWDGQTNGSRYRLMLPYGGGIITGQKQTDRAYTRP